MTDPDDDVARRYRELPREEPPSALDAAILAQGRRAVDARPGLLRRWSGPISIAAVLMLAVGVVSRMQVEQPGVETSVPAPQAPPPQPEAKAAAAPVPPPVAAEQARTPPPVAKRVQRAEKREAPAATPIPEPVPAPPPAPAPAQTITARTAAPPVPQAFRPDERAMNAQRAKIAADASPAAAAPATRTAGLAADSAVTAEAELERIAKLRADGRDEEADRALEDFRKRRPDYRIPEETWARVRPRQP